MTKTPLTPALTQELQSQLDASTKLVTPGFPEYGNAITRWSPTSVKTAGAVAYPQTAGEVSKLVTFASQRHIDLAIKCGGHSTGGTNSSEGGLVIDLGKMRKVTVDKAKKIIIAEGGALWDDVNKKTDECGLATVSATVNDVGVGGFTLGGGLGWLTGQYGTLTDNLVGAKIVLANGQILQASEQENSDLFWAIRGAGHNFGVVVEFRYKAYDQPNRIFAGNMIFRPDKLDPLFEALNQRHWSPNPKAAAHCTFIKFPEIGPAIALTLFYNGDEHEARVHFASVLKLDAVKSDVAEVSYYHSHNLIKDVSSGRKSLKGATFSPPIRPEFVQWLWNEFTNKIKEDPDLSQTTITIEFYDMSAVAEVPLEQTAFPTRGFFQTGIIKLCWTDRRKDDEVRAWGRYLQQRCRQEIKSEIAAQPQSQAFLEYANYSEPDDISFTAPFGVNQKKLARLKAKYDPQFLFDKTNPITPDPA